MLAYFSPGYAQSIRELAEKAETYLKKGDYPKAIQTYGEIIETLPDSKDFLPERIYYSKPYTDALLVYGSYDKVEKYLSDPEFASDPVLQLNLASALGYQQKYREALQILKTCGELEDLPVNMAGIINQNKGFLLYEIGEYREAETNFRKAATALEGTDLALLNSNLALALAQQAKFSEAVPLAEESVKSLKKAGQRYYKDYVRALRKYAEILLKSGDSKNASRIFRQYFDLEREWLKAQLETAPLNTRLNLWLSERPLLSKCFMLQDLEPEFMYEVAMFRRLTSLLGINRTSSLTSLLGLTPAQLRKSLSKEEAAVEFISYPDVFSNEQYAAVILTHNGEARFVNLFDEELIKFEYGPEGYSIFDAVKSDLRPLKNSLYSDSDLGAMVWDPIISGLPEEVTTIWFAPEGVFHFWGIENMPFKNQEKYDLRRLTSTAFLHNDYKKRFKNSTGKKNSGKEGLTVLIGGLDYSALPLDDITVKDADHEASQLLLERYGTNDVFGYLPGTRAEVDSVRTVCIQPLTYYQMGEKELKGLMGSTRNLHIATHGYSLDTGIRKRPELLSDSMAYDRSLTACGLALTGANVLHEFPDREDGLLSAREICDIDLSGADLVVLSACQTARGDVTDEGAAGLVRGFKNAGAGSVIATLWSVDDASTMLFMYAFYRALNEGKNKHEAFREAKEFLKNHTRQSSAKKFSPGTLAKSKNKTSMEKVYDEPYYWAPFILIDAF